MTRTVTDADRAAARRALADLTGTEPGLKNVRLLAAGLLDASPDHLRDFVVHLLDGLDSGAFPTLSEQMEACTMVAVVEQIRADRRAARPRYADLGVAVGAVFATTPLLVQEATEVLTRLGDLRSDAARVLRYAALEVLHTRALIEHATMLKDPGDDL